MKVVLKILLPLLIIAAAIGGFILLKKSAPETKSKEIKVVVPEVSILSISPQTEEPPVNSFGTVRPYFESTLTPEVSGLITEIAPDFRVGMKVTEGQPLVWIDPATFEATLTQQKSSLANAELTLAEEKIRAQQAAEDWKASGRDLATASDFVLRKPQLKSAQAAIDSVKASVRIATTNLDRTIISAPYDALVVARTASLGSLANQQQSIGRLVALSRIEIPTPLTPEQAARVDLSAQPKVTITSSTMPAARWEGQITRLEPLVDENQTITAIIEVPTPFRDPRASLAIGLFVNTAITAVPLTEVLKIPEAALINDQFLWALDPEDQLVRLPGQRVQSIGATTYFRPAETELKPPFRIVSRPLTNFQTGLKVTPKDS